MRLSFAATFFVLMFLFVLKSQASNCDSVLNKYPDLSEHVRFDASGKIKVPSQNSDILSQEINNDRQVVTYQNNYRLNGVATNRKSKLVSDKDSAFTRIIRYYDDLAKTIPETTVKLAGVGDRCFISQIVSQNKFLEFEYGTCNDLMPLIKNFGSDKLDKCEDVLSKSLSAMDKFDKAARSMNLPQILHGDEDPILGLEQQRIFLATTFLKTCRKYLPASSTSTASGTTAKGSTTK